MSKTYGEVDFNLSATSSSTGAFSYTISDANVATVTGSTTTIVGAGTTSVTVTQAADTNYNSATATMTLTVSQADIANASITAIPDQTYTGSAITISPTVTFNGSTVTETTDYTVSFANNTNAGTASLTITGTGNFTGAKTVSFTIVNAPTTDILLTTNIISETASLGSLIGTLSATDSDTSISSLTFSFTSSGDAQDDDNGSFTISGTSLLTSTTLDYETKTSYNIYVNVNDGTTNYAKAFTVSVTNVLEPITDLGFHISKAYKFNGTNNYIEVPYAAENHPSNFTIELWARLDQNTGTYQSPLSSRYGSAPWNNLSGYNFYAVNGLEKWAFTGGSGSWEDIVTTSSTNGEIYDGNNLKFGIWTHLASTYD